VHGLLVTAAMAGTLALSERTELRLRDPGLVGNQPSFDFEEAPDAKLTLASPLSTYFLEYSPQLTAWDLNVVGLSPALLNNGTARGEWRGRHWRLTLGENASYGGRNYASLLAGTTLGVESAQPMMGAPGGPQGPLGQVTVLPAVGKIILYEASMTTLSTVATFRRWQLTTEVGYQLAGGADAAARTILPFETGPLGFIELDHTLGPRDHLLETARGSEESFSSGPEVLMVEYDETWRHLWTRTTSLEFLAGVNEARARTGFSPPAAYQNLTNPVASVKLDQRLASRVDRGELQAALRVGPFINPVLGLVDERAEAQVGGKWAREHVGLRGSASFAQSVTNPYGAAVRLFMAEIGMSYELSRAVVFDVGERFMWQEPVDSTVAGGGTPPAFAAIAFTQEVTFVGLTLRADPLRF
jgi:hypothetical protein